MKKILSLILCVAMCATVFVGCGSEGTTTTQPAVDASGEEITADIALDVADGDLGEIKADNKMVIGMTLFAPMNYYDDNGEFVGFETEFANAVCAKLGLEAEFVEINWDSKEIELNSKNIDCIWNGMTITPERAENMDISVPYMKNRQVMVVKAENLEKFTASVADAAVVAEAGSAGEELATSDEFFAGASFTPVDSMAKALMEVKSGTADVAIVDYVTSIGSIGEGTDYADLVAVEALEFAPEEYGIAFRKDTNTAEAVNEAIAALIADGTLDMIAAKYKLQNLLIK